MTHHRVELDALTPVLTASQRCDRCTARAYVWVNVLVPDRAKDCDLLFCAHHYGTHMPELTRIGATVLADQRSELQVKQPVTV